MKRSLSESSILSEGSTAARHGLAEMMRKVKVFQIQHLRSQRLKLL